MHELPWLDALDRGGLSDGSSLLLVGSMAAGEHHREGRYGDVDLYLFGSAEARDAVLASVQDPRVHVALLPDDALARLPHTYRIFEARELGVSVCGPDPRTRLPTVTVESLHSGDLNDILAWRLLSCGKIRDADDPERISYAAAKNYLDLGIWLAGQLDLLVAGHRRRIDALSSIKRPVADSLSPLLAAWLRTAEEALLVKKGELCWRQPGLQLELTIDSLATAARLVLAGAAPRSELSDKSLRRRLSVTRNLLKNSSDLPWSARWKVFMNPHRELLRAACTISRGGNWNPKEFECIHRIVFGGAVE